MAHRLRIRLVCLTFLLLGGWSGPLTAHQDPCHRLHAYPSDRHTYVCGDLGHCEQCPDTPYGEGGHPTPTAIVQGRRGLLPRCGGVLHAGRGLYREDCEGLR
jgi:hypothetical protein